MADNDGNALFICEYTVDREKIFSWAKSRRLSTPELVMTLFWCIFAAFVFVYTLFSGMYFLFLIVLYCLYHGLFRRLLLLSRRSRALAEQFGQTWTRRYTLRKEDILLEESSVSIRTSYAEIARMEEKEDCFLLWLNDKSCFRLFDDSFLLGTPEECREYLRQRLASREAS